MNVNPVVRKGLGPIDDQHNGEEIAIFERRPWTTSGGAAGVMAEIKSRIGRLDRKWRPR